MKSFLYGAYIALLMMLYTNAIAQQKTDANIVGHVIDKKTEQHIPYVTISIKGTVIAIATDKTGHYILSNIPVGEHTAIASSLGYKNAEINIKIQKGVTTTVNFSLETEPIEIGGIVVTSNRGEVRRRESSTIVNVAGAKLFENVAAASPAEVLDFQSGMRIEWNCGNCGVPQVRINGLQGQYSQILLDSKPMFSSLAAVYGLEQMPAGIIDRIEVIRGGGSALFGSNAIGGVVNIITKNPINNTVSVSNTTALIGREAFDLNTSLNASIVSSENKTGVYIFGMLRDRQQYDRNGDKFSEIPKISSPTIGLRGYHNLGAYTKLTAQYHHTSEFRRGGNMFEMPPHQADIAEQTDHKIDGGTIDIEGYTPNLKQKYSIYMSAQNIARKSYFGTNQNHDAYGSTKDITALTGGQWGYNFHKLWFMPSTLTLGAEYTHNHLKDNMLGYNRQIRQITNNIGMFAQNEWRGEKMSILLGIRADKHNLVKNVIVNPRINVRYAPNQNIAIRASYASGYRAPQAYDEDLHVAAVGGEVAIISIAHDLKPEFSHSLSASIDIFKNWGLWQVNFLVEGFYTDLRNVFTLVEKGHDQQGNLLLERQNASGAKVYGISGEIRTSYNNKIDIQAGLTAQKSRYHKPQEWSSKVAPTREMFRSPDMYGYAILNYNPTKQWTATISTNYTSKMLVQHYAGYIKYDTEIRTPEFWDIGLRAAYRIQTRNAIAIEFSAGVKNVFDQFQKDLDIGAKKDAKFIYGPALPRTIYLGVKFTI